MFNLFSMNIWNQRFLNKFYFYFSKQTSFFFWAFLIPFLISLFPEFQLLETTQKLPRQNIQRLIPPRLDCHIIFHRLGTKKKERSVISGRRAVICYAPMPWMGRTQQREATPALSRAVLLPLINVSSSTLLLRDQQPVWMLMMLPGVGRKM